MNEKVHWFVKKFLCSAINNENFQEVLPTKHYYMPHTTASGQAK